MTRRAAAGNLNILLIPQTVTAATTPDEAGHVTETWTDHAAAVWCRFLKQSSREFVLAQQVHHDATHVVEMRHVPAFMGTAAERNEQTRFRVSKDGTTRFLYPLGWVDVDEAGHTWRVTCKESQ